MKSTGEKIKEFILSKGMSDRAFALSCKIDPAQLNKYTQGINEPSLKTLRKIKGKYPDFDSDSIDKTINISIETNDKERLSAMEETIKVLEQRIESRDRTIEVLTEQVQELRRKKEG